MVSVRKTRRTNMKKELIDEEPSNDLEGRKRIH
jgi:hypothetical protein